MNSVVIIIAGICQRDFRWTEMFLFNSSQSKGIRLDGEQETKIGILKRGKKISLIKTFKLSIKTIF